ncbi:MAG: TerB family tellurite resistance protein [Bacteroidota bacterium]|nr:TerB family tellurite resistance protein [Bacteroidota bacterium]
MKKYFIIGWVVFFFSATAMCQSQEIQQLQIDVQKLAQLRAMLSDLKEGYQVLARGYNSIRDLSQSNFNLHCQYLQSLLQVSPAVRNFSGVAAIVTSVHFLVSESRGTIRQFSSSGEFSEMEISYMTRVYSNLLNQSLQSLSDLATVLTPGALRMTDEARLQTIQKIETQVRDQQDFFTYFTNRAQLLSIQRTREVSDLSVINQLYLHKP